MYDLLWLSHRILSSLFSRTYISCCSTEVLGCSDVIFQKCFPNQGTKFHPDDPTELGFVLQRKYEVVRLPFDLRLHVVTNLVISDILIMVPQVFQLIGLQYCLLKHQLVLRWWKFEFLLPEWFLHSRTWVCSIQGSKWDGNHGTCRYGIPAVVWSV